MQKWAQPSLKWVMKVGHHHFALRFRPAVCTVARPPNELNSGEFGFEGVVLVRAFANV